MDESVCEFVPCGREVYNKSRQLCHTHYQQQRVGKPLTVITRPKGPYNPHNPCGFPGCGRDAQTMKYCDGHRQQLDRGVAPEDLTPLRPRAKRMRKAPHGAALVRVAGLKQCTRCEMWKPEEDYTGLSSTKDGLSPRCRACDREAREARTDKFDRRLRHFYKITEVDFNLILKWQGGVCAICGRTDEEAHTRGEPLYVDHDHSCCPGMTPRGDCTRGLLCSACNRGIGVFHEDVQALKNAIAYLQGPLITPGLLGAWAAALEGAPTGTAPDADNRHMQGCDVDKEFVAQGNQRGACAFPGCERQLASDQWCATHHDQWRHGLPMKLLQRAVSYRECTAPGCTRDARTKEFCSGHMQQLRRGILREQMTPLLIRAPRKRTRPRGAATERDAAGNKECSRCQEWKSEDAYTKNRQALDGLEPRCRQCAKEERGARTDRRDRFLRRLYEMTEEQFNLILDHQGGACAICRRTADEAHTKGDPLHVDHDHACCPKLPACGDCNRGLLCSDCNRGLGVFRESVEALHGAVRYLRRPNITRQQLSDWATTNEAVEGTGVNAEV